MAGRTLFSIDSAGRLVYRKTGRLAPSGYKVGTGSRRNIVYGPNGRQAGTLSYKIKDVKTKKRDKAIKEATRKARRKAAQKAKAKPKHTKEKAAEALTAEEAQDRFMQDLENGKFETTLDPEKSKETIEEFCRMVRQSLKMDLPGSLKGIVDKVSDEAIWNAYCSNAFAFEVYFLYSGRSNEDSDRTSRWILGLIQEMQRGGA